MDFTISPTNSLGLQGQMMLVFMQSCNFTKYLKNGALDSSSAVYR